MGKKVNPKSIDSLKLVSGVLIWAFSALGGLLLWMNPLTLPISGVALTFVSSVVEIGVLAVLSLLLLRDHNGGLTVGGMFAFAGIAFPFSVLSGMLAVPGNIILYLIPVLWFCASAPLSKVVPMILLTLLPVALLITSLSAT